MSDVCRNEDRNVNERIGERICFLRKSILGISCEEFASEIGISRYRLMRIENGKGQVPAAIIRTLSMNYNIPPTWLLSMEENECAFFKQKAEKTEVDKLSAEG